MSNGAEASPVVDVEVTTHGDFPGIAEYARTKIGGLARIVHRPILRARVRLTRSHDPAVERPVVAVHLHQPVGPDGRGRGSRIRARAAGVLHTDRRCRAPRSWWWALRCCIHLVLFPHSTRYAVRSG